jgi:site-specific recombinase XerD
MKISLVLLKTKVESKKGFPIVVNLYHKGKQKRITLNLFSKLEHWDHEKQVPLVLHSDYDYIFPEVIDLKFKIKELERKKETDFKKIEKYLKGDLNTSKNPITNDFYKFADILISEKEKNGNLSNAKVYATAKKQLKRFEPNLTFDDFNYNVLIGFVNEKKREGVKSTSIHNYLRTLRAIYNQAVLRDITDDEKPFTGVFKGLKVRSHQMRKKYLTIDDIKRIEDADFTGLMDYTRDLFLLQFYLGGQDLIDVYKLKRSNVVNDRVFFKRSKVANGYQFDLLASKKVKAILKKYKQPDDLLPGRKDYAGYETFRRRYGRYLIDMQNKLGIKVQPLGGNLGIKVARHTFANIGKRLGIEEDMLRELMGHERDDIDNFYKDRYPEEERDQAQLKIIVDIK